MKKLILFDIDGTLIKSSNEHKKAFSYAFKKVYNIEAEINFINYNGKTDQQIIIEVLKKKGLNEKEILSKIKKCMNEMETFFENQNKNIKIQEGVNEILLHLNEKHILGLITGNLEKIAKSKLDNINKYSYFKIGGFGSDGIKRSDLIKIAIKRAKKIYKFDEVIVIGDTPNDIIAGKEAKVKTIAVTTGEYSKYKLKKFNPDLIVENLKNKKMFKL